MNASRDKAMAVRLLAGLLAAIASLWSVFCLLLLWACAFHPGAVLVFAPGYLVTAGYIWRASTTPDLGARQLIWVASLLVQGAWLVLFLLDFRLPQDFSQALLMSWWLLACAGSAWALHLESSVPDEPGRRVDGTA